MPAFHAQQVRRAGHVDVEEGTAHQEVRGFRRDVLGELGEALGGDDPGQPALAATAHEVGHGSQADAAGIVGGVGGGGGGEELRLVDDDEGRVPMLAVGIEQRVEEGRRGAQLSVDLEVFEVEHDGHAMAAHAGGNGGEVTLAIGGVENDMAVAFGEADEVALRVDHHVLHEAGALLEQSPQQVGLSRAGIALHEQARGEQLLEIDAGGCAGAGLADDDLRSHPLLELLIPPGLSTGGGGAEQRALSRSQETALLLSYNICKLSYPTPCRVKFSFHHGLGGVSWFPHHAHVARSPVRAWSAGS